MAVAAVAVATEIETPPVAMAAGGNVDMAAGGWMASQAGTNGSLARRYVPLGVVSLPENNLFKGCTAR